YHGTAGCFEPRRCHVPLSAEYTFAAGCALGPGPRHGSGVPPSGSPRVRELGLSRVRGLLLAGYHPWLLLPAGVHRGLVGMPDEVKGVATGPYFIFLSRCGKFVYVAWPEQPPVPSGAAPVERHISYLVTQLAGSPPTSSPLSISGSISAYSSLLVSKICPRS